MSEVLDAWEKEASASQLYSQPYSQGVIRHRDRRILALINLVRKQHAELLDQKLFMSKLVQFAKANEKRIDTALALTEELK